MCMNRFNLGARTNWLPLSLALATLASSFSASNLNAQSVGNGAPPAGYAQWNARQQEAGYAARPLYPSTEQRYAVPTPQQAAVQSQAAAQQANPNTAGQWQASTAQQQPAAAPAGQQRQLANFGQVQTPPGQQRAAAPHERVASQTSNDRWQANAVSNKIVNNNSGEDWIRDEKIVKKLNSDVERMEMTVSTSRILTIEGKFSRAQVNNPDILSVTPLAPNELQISAQAPGITQVHLWDDNKRVYSLDVAVYGDVQELQRALQDQYPDSSVKVYRYSNSLVLSGYVDRPDYVSSIVRLSEDYAPKIINNMKVGGVQQILLNVQIMEVSRTKLRDMGFDFANFNGNDAVVSSISGLISSSALNPGVVTPAGGATGDTVRFGVIDGSNSFFGFLKLLRQNSLAKILAEPKLVTVSGRPASFNVGGEIPVPVPQSLGSVTIEYKKYGTQVDFLPIVLGNGNIRLEVRPRISELDYTNTVTINGSIIPGLKERTIDTGVEMKAGQTLALAGLVQNRVEANNRGIPVLADLPWLGAAFRSVHHQNNEIELLIMVRPELVQAMDPHEVPEGGPGLNTVDPCDTDLYWRGHMEVPRCSGCNSGNCKDCMSRQDSGQYMGNPGNTLDGAPVNYPRMPANPSAQNSQASRTQSPPAYATQKGRSSNSNAAVRQPTTYSPPVQQTASNQSNPVNQQAPQYRYEPARTAPTGTSGNTPGMIGPLGYDVVK